MRRIRQVLQLHFGARASARAIARTVGVGRSTVQDYLARAAAAGLIWPLAPDLTDEALEQRLFPAPSNRPGARRYVVAGRYSVSSNQFEPQLAADESGGRLQGCGCRCRAGAFPDPRSTGIGRAILPSRRARRPGAPRSGEFRDARA